jgi:ankyrin repeat protein
LWFDKEMNTSCVNYNPAVKPLPLDLAEFLTDPYMFRVSEEFLNTVVLEESETSLIHCVKLQNEAAVDVLLRCNIDPNQYNRRGVTPISAAAHNGFVPIMRLLIKAGAFVNAVNQSGSTALIQAAHFGHFEAVKLLLEEHANPDFANTKGTTALMRASQEGHVAITRALITSGVDVNRRNHEGMNALMLASQRGHAEIVMILIEAGAAKDEQTAQGSTALMLACKRGHEKCVEALVSMGAEIFMRDRRYRTARDTALRRNHTGLLVWLDTQVQVIKIQERHLAKRNEVIKDIRDAYIQGKLQLSPADQFVADLVTAVKDTSVVTSSGDNSETKQQRLEEGQRTLIQDFLDSSPHLSFHSNAPEMTLQTIRSVLAGEYMQAAKAVPEYRTASRPAIRCVDYVDWLWPLLFQRVLALPPGVFETVIDFLPMPRVWSWSLSHMLLRCRLAPQQAVMDLSIIMDEILCDSNVVGDNVQQNLLVKIARSPHLHDLLIAYHGITPAFLERLCAWSDIQGLVSHMGTGDNQIEYKFPLARQMLQSSIYVFRWFRMRNCATSSLGLIPNKSPSFVSLGNTSASSTTVASRGRKRVTFSPFSNSSAMANAVSGGGTMAPAFAATAVNTSDLYAGVDTTVPMGFIDQEEVDLLNVTDPTEHHAMDIDTEVAVIMEPDTDSELHLGAEGEDAGEDSDNDNAPLAMPPAAPPVITQAAMAAAFGAATQHLLPPPMPAHQQQQVQQQQFHLTAQQQHLLHQQQVTLQQHQQRLHQMHMQQQQQLQMQLQQQQIQMQQQLQQYQEQQQQQQQQQQQNRHSSHH